MVVDCAPVLKVGCPMTFPPSGSPSFPSGQGDGYGGGYSNGPGGGFGGPGFGAPGGQAPGWGPDTGAQPFGAPQGYGRGYGAGTGQGYGYGFDQGGVPGGFPGSAPRPPAPRGKVWLWVSVACVVVALAAGIGGWAVSRSGDDGSSSSSTADGGGRSGGPLTPEELTNQHLGMTDLDEFQEWTRAHVISVAADEMLTGTQSDLDSYHEYVGGGAYRASSATPLPELQSAGGDVIGVFTAGMLSELVTEWGCVGQEELESLVRVGIVDAGGVEQGSVYYGVVDGEYMFLTLAMEPDVKMAVDMSEVADGSCI